LGEAKRKATAAETISVLIPERGRPDMLERLITSLLTTAGDDDHIEILVAIDADDPAWVGREPFVHSKTRYFRWPRPLTLGEKLNKLKDEARGGVLWFIANDMVMDTNGWPEKMRQAVAKLPNGIGVPYVRDVLHPGHASYPILTRRFVDAVGFFAPPCYPFWWLDTHLDALGILVGQHFEADVVVSAPEGRGKTHGLIDLPFWVEFYEALAPIRMREAIQLAEAAHGEGSLAFADVMRGIGQRQQWCALRTAHLSSPEFLAAWSDTAASPPHPEYAKVKAYAVQMMADIRKQMPTRPKIAIAVPSGRTWEATTANCVAALAAHSAISGIEVCLLNVQSSQISHSRNMTVELALKENCQFIFWIDSDMKFPPDTLLNLLRHNKDIVGATYNRRTPPYSTLGKLKGDRPSDDALRGGLHEALVMPGGMMLVATSVYKKLSWPWYGECFRPAGADGLESFRALLKDYFREIPPADALDELSETKLGAWLKAGGFDLTEGQGEVCNILSEDIFFTKKARKNGFEVWCCLDTTFKTVHLGVQEITCEPEQHQRLAAD
jgi:hypothetical protein